MTYRTRDDDPVEPAPPGLCVRCGHLLEWHDGRSLEGDSTSGLCSLLDCDCQEALPGG